MRSKLNKFELGMGVSGPEGSRYSEVPCPEGSMNSCVLYRLGTVNSKSFVSKVLLRIKWKFELTVHF